MFLSYSMNVIDCKIEFTRHHNTKVNQTFYPYAWYIHMRSSSEASNGYLQLRLDYTRIIASSDNRTYIAPRKYFLWSAYVPTPDWDIYHYVIPFWYIHYLLMILATPYVLINVDQLILNCVIIKPEYLADTYFQLFHIPLHEPLYWDITMRQCCYC